MPSKGQKQTEEAKQRISLANKGKKRSESQKLQLSLSFKGRTPWNKGKVWSEEHKLKLSKSHTGLKQPHIGVPRTKETKKKISDYWKTHKRVTSLETRKKHSQNMIYKMRTRIIPSNNTKIEVSMEKELSRLEIPYIQQWKYEFGLADFFLPDKNIIIECDGIYWHNRPNIKERDKKKEEHLISLGYKVFRFTDKEILTDVSNCVKQVLT